MQQKRLHFWIRGDREQSKHAGSSYAGRCVYCVWIQLHTHTHTVTEKHRLIKMFLCFRCARRRSHTRTLLMHQCWWHCVRKIKRTHTHIQRHTHTHVFSVMVFSKRGHCYKEVSPTGNPFAFPCNYHALLLKTPWTSTVAMDTRHFTPLPFPMYCIFPFSGRPVIPMDWLRLLLHTRTCCFVHDFKCLTNCEECKKKALPRGTPCVRETEK